MTILITGGAGFIGQKLAKRLSEAGEEIVIIDPAIDSIENPSEKCILIKGDVSDLSFLEKICKDYNFSAVFHLAAILPPKTEEDPYAAFKVNVEGTINIIKCALKNDFSTIIYPSSATVFGPDRRPPFTEEDLMDPWTVYSSFKICNEIIGSIFSKKYDISFRAVRLPVVIGPGRSKHLGMTKYPTEIIEEALEGRPYIVDVPPNTRVPIIYVEDAVQILINLWRLEDIDFEIYNVDGLWVTAEEIAKGVKKYIPSAEITFKEPERKEIQSILSGVKEKQKEGQFGLRGKRLLDEILQEYIGRK
ncbi:MAG: NAD(P)-dependent oxidoreductase [Asgard group archaeon]|nr:NAD(P)-dependent oxidoreductase [Asgard group archaeon]